MATHVATPITRPHSDFWDSPRAIGAAALAGLVLAGAVLTTAAIGGTGRSAQPPTQVSGSGNRAFGETQMPVNGALAGGAEAPPTGGHGELP